MRVKAAGGVRGADGDELRAECGEDGNVGGHQAEERMLLSELEHRAHRLLHAPGGKFEWLAFLFPTIAYEPSKLKIPLVQSTPAPNLPLPVLMPLSLLPVGTSANSESANPDPPGPC